MRKPRGGWTRTVFQEMGGLVGGLMYLKRCFKVLPFSLSDVHSLSYLVLFV